MDTLIYQGPNTHLTTNQLIDNLLHPVSGMIAVDTETISIKNKTCIGIGVAINPDETYYLTVFPKQCPKLLDILALVANEAITKLYHNAVFDLDVLEILSKELRVSKPDATNIQDTSLLSQINGERAGLDYQSTIHLGWSNPHSIGGLLDKAKQDGHKRPTMLDVDTRDIATKCIYDTLATYQLYEYFNGNLSTKARDCYEVDRKLLGILRRVQNKGIAIDGDKLQGHHRKLQQQLSHYASICEDYDFNPASSKQVGLLLSSRGNYLPLTKSGRQLQTGESILSRLDDPLASVVLNYRKAQKLLGTYVEPWLESERAYTHFRLDLATGRLASYDRNLQNIPPSLRDIFRPDSGTWTWTDISQLEMRTWAYITQDPTMLKAYANGEDIHGITQMALWPSSNLDNKEQRTRTKTFNFALIFDASAYELGQNTGLSTEECQQFKDTWMGLYSTGAQWIREQIADTTPYRETLYGRKMVLPDIGFKGQKHTNNCKVNYPIQGTGADIIKRSMVYMADNGYEEALRLQVHDELLFDGDVDIPVELDNICPEFSTPFETKRGRYWGDS